MNVMSSWILSHTLCSDQLVQAFKEYIHKIEQVAAVVY